MAKYIVDYYETYSKSYEVEACNKEEAEEIVKSDIAEGRRQAPYNCTELDIKYINDLTEIRNNAKMVAKRDGYNQVIIEDNDGYYSFSRKYDGCCPLWYGRIIEEITY